MNQTACASALALLMAGCFATTSAHAQNGPTNLVSVCTGVSLPRSAVTDTIAPVIGGIVSPLQGAVNPLLATATPPLSIDLAGLLANAAAGAPITLQALNVNGAVVGPTDACDAQADSVSLSTVSGVAIGGNRITGLGNTGQEALAGDLNAIAIGNGALTAGSATGAVAIGQGATVGAGATGALALGQGAVATGANGVALGAGSTASRGTTVAAGEVSVGAAGAERQITNVAAGTAATDAATVGQVTALADRAVQYDGAARDRVTLAGAAGTTLTNVAAGAIGATSTDAVNGAQLNATNVQVATNTSAITTLTTNVGNGAVGPVRYSNAATPATPNGGVPTNDVALVGAAAGPVGLHNVAGGRIAAGSTDAVNGGQVFGLALTAVNAVAYDTDASGTRTNTVTLAGGTAAAPVRVTNVSGGTLAPGSSDAVNGAQLAATNQAVATATTLGQNSVQYGPSRTTVTFNGGGTATTLQNVAPGVSATDAVNVGQLNGAVTQANTYTDSRLTTLNFDLRRMQRDANAGTAGALAAAGLPQAYEAGKGMIAIAGGTYRNATAVAIGMSKAFDDGHTVVKLSGSYDSRSRVGASGGVGYQF